MSTARFRYLYYPGFEPDLPWLKSVLLLTDEVSRIIPQSAEHVDSEGIQKLRDLFPESLTSFSPDPHDVNLCPEDCDGLGIALSLLARNNRAKKLFGRKAKIEKTRIRIVPGLVAIEGGYVFLHNRKVSDVVKRLLLRHGALHKGAAGISDDWLVVDKVAANLVISQVADNIARLRGFNTITNQELDFAMKAGSGFWRARSRREAEGTLLSGIAKVSIPAVTSMLGWKDYKELRNSYADLRPAFQELTMEIMAAHRLDRIDDPGVLAARVNEIANAFNREVENYRKSKFAKKFVEWSPLCVGGVLSIATSFASPPAGAIMTGVTVAFQVIEKLRKPDHPFHAHATCHRLLAGLRNDIQTKYCDRFLTS